ncbi:hypothetical protein [Dactylosporangium sp. NPDC051541]|uniref:hypothetical protein n=1 Tax=Dactylosporangium sp. NPDC051541 TaxID=3363977 RepID=UPI00379DAE3F
MDDDDRFGIDLLTPLRRDPLGPSAVDVRRAVAKGERRQATVRAAAAGVTVLAVLGGVWVVTERGGAEPGPAPAASVPWGPPAPRACTPKQLENPPKYPAIAQVQGGDPTGRYLIGLVAAGYDRDGHSGGGTYGWWEDGHWHDLDPQGRNPTDVNSRGVIVGTRPPTEFPDAGTAWVYKDGQVRDLVGAKAAAVGINDKGQIVGYVGGSGVMWTVDDPNPVPLKVPAGYSGPARVGGIDEDGTVAGGLKRDGHDVPVVWLPGGEVKPIDAVGGDEDVSAGAIRNGWVILSGTDRQMLWNLRTGGAPVEMDRSITTGPNASGWYVAQTSAAAELVTPRGRVKLAQPAEAPVGPPGALASSKIQVHAISDDGSLIAGELPVTNQADHAIAYVWTCR